MNKVILLFGLLSLTLAYSVPGNWQDLNLNTNLVNSPFQRAVVLLSNALNDKQLTLNMINKASQKENYSGFSIKIEFTYGAKNPHENPIGFQQLKGTVETSHMSWNLPENNQIDNLNLSSQQQLLKAQIVASWVQWSIDNDRYRNDKSNELNQYWVFLQNALRQKGVNLIRFDQADTIRRLKWRFAFTYNIAGSAEAKQGEAILYRGEKNIELLELTLNGKKQ